MKQELAVGEMLDVEGFDPVTVDTSEIRRLSNSIPKDGNIDINNAEIMATKYLRGADLCTEILAIATAHMHRTDALKKKAYAEAALTKSANAGIKTDKSRAWFADADDDYVNACNEHGKAQAFFRWISNKHESFIKAHYMCKDVLKRHIMQEQTGNWNGKMPGEPDPAW